MKHFPVVVSPALSSLFFYLSIFCCCCCCCCCLREAFEALWEGVFLFFFCDSISLLPSQPFFLDIIDVNSRFSETLRRIKKHFSHPNSPHSTTYLPNKCLVPNTPGHTFFTGKTVSGEWESTEGDKLVILSPAPPSNPTPSHQPGLCCVESDKGFQGFCQSPIKVSNNEIILWWGGRFCYFFIYFFIYFLEQN